MLLTPKNRNYRKDHKGSRALRGSRWSKSNTSCVSLGSYAIKSLESRNLKASHIEAVRRVSSRQIKSSGHIFLRVFPYKPVSGKPTKVRMGKGKGNVRFWACPVKPGQILFEIRGNHSPSLAFDPSSKACHKLPISTKIVSYPSAQMPSAPATSPPFVLPSH